MERFLIQSLFLLLTSYHLPLTTLQVTINQSPAGQ